MIYAMPNNINYFQNTSLKGGSEECRVYDIRYAKQHQLFPEHVSEGGDPKNAEFMIYAMPNNINYFQNTSLKGDPKNAEFIIRTAKQNQLFPEYVSDGVLLFLKPAGREK
ncbi:hypothetical protein CLV32_4027 [Pedobacter duraquae]|uniref:Uncharacterized protein n=1 Tax=Pedobacter duraquae TaxID=425511 RepID=A0A4R6IF56_9SPHI|nr:hypothetical protein CLV32_4027 [Pedobacter duraquae]